MIKKVNMRLVQGDPNEVNPNDVLVVFSNETGLPCEVKGTGFELTDAKIQTNASATITTEVGTTEYTIDVADLLSSGYDALKGTITVTIA